MYMLVAWAVAATGGVQIISERNDLYTIGDPLQPGVQRMLQNKTMTIRCSSSDMGVPADFSIVEPDGTNHTLTIVCQPVQYHYTIQPVEYLYDRVFLIVHEFCSVRDESYQNETQDILKRIPGGGILPPTRSLLAAPKTPVKIGLGRAALLVGGGLALYTAGCSFSILPSSICPNNGMKDLEDEINNLKGKYAELEQAGLDRMDKIRELAGKQNQWELQTQDTFSRLIQTDKDIALAINATNERVDLNAKLIEQNTIGLNETYQAVVRLSAGVREEQDKLWQSLLNTRQTFTDQIGSVSAEVAALANALLNTTERIEQMINQMQSKTESRTALDYQRVRAVAKAVRKLATTIKQLNERTLVKRMLTRLTQRTIREDILPGWSAFLDDLGQAPDPDYALPWYVLVDRVHFYSEIDVVGTYYATEDILSFYCRSDNLLDTPSHTMDFETILENVGPPGCNPENSSCVCYVIHENQYCEATLDNLTADAWTQLRLDWVLRTCVDSVMVGLTQATLTTWLDLKSVLSTMCYGALREDTGWKVASERNRMWVDVLQRPGACNMGMEVLVDPVTHGTTFALAGMEYMANAWNEVQIVMDYIGNEVDGTIPVDLSFNEVPFTRIAKQDASCTQAAFIAHNNESVSVYKVTYQARVAVVDISIDGVTHDSYDVTVDTEADFLLPSDYIMIGSPFPEDGLIYDVPDRAVSLEPIAPAREGTVTYMVRA
jgi:predicted  nucleic acid-binding Zn-ribbon protein